METRFIASLPVSSSPYVSALLALAVFVVLANFFGGLRVILDKPYRIGDSIVLDGGERGEVVAIGLRGTRIKTCGDAQITIPDSIIANTKVVNECATALSFELLAWARESALRGRTMHEINCEIYKEFMRLGIRIPFPQRDVHLPPGDPA